MLFTAPVYAGANVAVKGEGDEVPSYVRSDITGYDFHGEDLHLSSIAGAIARDADFSDVDLHGTTLTLSDLKGSNLNGINLNPDINIKVDIYDKDYEIINKTNLHRARLAKFKKSKFNGEFIYLDKDENVYKIINGVKKYL